MRTPPLIRTKDEVKLKIDLLEVRTVLYLLNEVQLTSVNISYINETHTKFYL